MLACIAIVLLVSKAYAQHSARLMHGRDTIVFVAADDRTFEMSYRLANNLDTATIIFDPNYHPSGVFTRVDSDANGLHIRGGAYSIEATTSPFAITVRDANDRIVFATYPDTGFRSNGCYAQILQHADYYGLDNRTWGLARGDWPAWVFTGDYGKASGLLLWTTDGYGIVADVDDGGANATGWTGNFYYDKTNSRRRDNHLYMTFGTPWQIFRSFADILGKPTMPPLWSLGFLHSKWGQDQKDDYDLAHQYRSRNIGVDAFAFDYEWMDWGQPWGEFRWNPTAFPDAESGVFADSMQKLGISLMGIRKPRIHVDQPEGQYAVTHKYFLPDSAFYDYVSFQRVALLDFYNPKVRQWYWQSLVDSSRDPFKRGLKALWNDEVGYHRSLYCPNMQKAQYDGQRSYNNYRVFSLNRNYSVGVNKFAYGMWTGDIQSDFTTLQFQKQGVLNSALLGLGWWSMDIGGFWGYPDSSVGVAERYIRWMELGAFVPFFRIHGCIGREREPWLYGTEAERVSREIIKLRYTFLPYTYGLFRTFVDDGIPPVRPYVFDYPTDFISHYENKAELYGPSMIVAPVVDSLARSITFHVPPGTWVNYYTDSLVAGSADATLDAPLDRVPILIKRGAIIPEQIPGRFSLDSESYRDIRFHVYSGASDTTSYYEDDFTSYNYEHGEYAKIPYRHTYSRDAEHITVGAQEGEYAVRPRHGFFIVHCLDRGIARVLYDGVALDTMSLSDVYDRTQTGWALDSIAHQLVISVSDPFRAADIILEPIIDYSKPAESLRQIAVDVVSNPTQGSIRWNVYSPTDTDIHSTISTVTGAIVYQSNDHAFAGENLFSPNGTVFTPGTYELVVTGKGWSVTKKVIVLSR
ncbi:MAG: DUF5110 domain-containing protein [Bacteroidetes bacterium]|nr:DUF5110 domain-containing protein [Bacteroidota bacterium]